MNRWPVTGGILRALAFVIALTAAIDPAITSNRTTKPEVAVLAVDARADSVLADRVARELAKSFTVSRARGSKAEATVLVGDRLPERRGELASPVFAVVPARTGPTVTLDAVRAPAAAPAESRVPVAAVARVTGARGRTVEIRLQIGALVVDRITRTVATDDERVPASLSYVPTTPGAAALRVTASLGNSSADSADVVVDARTKRWAVLFFDPRPSWMSTFVRRAIERDPRFVVTSRVVTSRNVSTDAGQPPGRLGDLAAFALFDAVVVGAPESLGERDVSGLEAFLRRRGGGVVLLLDRRAAGSVDRLTGADRWIVDSAARPVSVVGAAGDSVALRASELAWPTRLPAGAEPVASSVATSRDTAAHGPAIWRSRVGAGELIVSGVLDSWRFRDPAMSGFDRFWQAMVAEVANGAPPAVAARLSSSVLLPGEEADVRVTVRDAALSSAPSVRATVGATLESADGARRVVRLWPDGSPGELSGVMRAPATPGVYRLVVSADGSEADVPVVVARGAARARSGDVPMLSAWVGTRAGRTLEEPRLGELSVVVRSAIRPAPRRVTWNPMRSAWWILPFALALSGEWWLRRRRGLP